MLVFGKIWLLPTRRGWKLTSSCMSFHCLLGELVAFLALWLGHFFLPYDVVRPKTFYMASLMAKKLEFLQHPPFWVIFTMDLTSFPLTQNVLIWLIQIFLSRIFFSCQICKSTGYDFTLFGARMPFRKF